MMRIIEVYKRALAAVMVSQIAAFCLSAEGETHYRTQEEKAQLWNELGLEYAAHNISHEYLDTFNLVAYFKKNLKKPIDIDYTMTIIPHKTIKKSKYLKRLNNTFNPAFFIVEQEGKKNAIDGIYLKESSPIGLGAYAATRYEPNEIVGEYTGEIKYHSDSIETCSYYGSSLTVNRDFESEVYPAIFINNQSDYVLRFLDAHPHFFAHPNDDDKTPLVIDSKKHRNEISFINNSRFPNIRIQRAIKLIITNREPYNIKEIKIVTIAQAIKTIQENDELLMNYMYLPEVYQDKQFIDYYPGTSCYRCKNQKISVCSRCKIARYCSQKCQTADWGEHKIFCHKPH